MTTEDPEAAAARSRLEKLAADRKRTEKRLTDLQEESRAAVVEVLLAEALRPADVARAIGYDRQHVGRIARDAKVPRLRKPTVGREVEAAHASVRPEPRLAAPIDPLADMPPWLRKFPSIAAMSHDEARQRAARLEVERPEWFAENREDCTAEPKWVDHAMLAADAQDSAE